MSSLKIIKDYLEQSEYRNKFFDFTPKALYGAEFKKWYEMGKWNKKYHLVSLLKGEELIANVAYSIMNLWVAGKRVKALQFATVATLPAFQHQGYARTLMFEVIKSHEKEISVMFLFANEHVLDFYPRFGFRQIQESVFWLHANQFQSLYGAHKLSIYQPKDHDLLADFLAKRLPLTKVFGADDYQHIFWWHCIYFYDDCIYYVPELDVVVICEIEAEKLHIYDILFKTSFSFSTLVPKIITNEVQSIVFHFTPELLDVKSDGCVEYKESPLFVKGDFLPRGTKFKFPVLAQT